MKVMKLQKFFSVRCLTALYHLGVCMTTSNGPQSPVTLKWTDSLFVHDKWRWNMTAWSRTLQLESNDPVEPVLCRCMDVCPVTIQKSVASDAVFLWRPQHILHWVSKSLSFIFDDNLLQCKPIQIIFDRSVAEVIWNKLSFANVNNVLCVASLHRKWHPFFSRFHSVEILMLHLTQFLWWYCGRSCFLQSLNNCKSH